MMVSAAARAQDHAKADNSEGIIVKCNEEVEKCFPSDSNFNLDVNETSKNEVSSRPRENVESKKQEFTGKNSEDFEDNVDKKASIEKEKNFEESEEEKIPEEYEDEKRLEKDDGEYTEENDQNQDDPSLSMINETGSCDGHEVEDQPCSSELYGLIPEEDSIYQIEIPSSFCDDSQDDKLEESCKKTFVTTSPCLENRVGVLKFGSAKSSTSTPKSSDKNEDVMTWLDTKCDERVLNNYKKKRVDRGMLSIPSEGDLKSNDQGPIKRKVHPKYAVHSENKIVVSNSEIAMSSKENELFHSKIPTSNKRKRETSGDSVFQPAKREKLGPFEWVGKWIMRCVNGLLGLYE